MCRLFKLFISLHICISFLLLEFCTCFNDHNESAYYNKKDFFVKAYELLDAGEYERSFEILRICVHYDTRCLTLIGRFYYLGLHPVKRDVCSALYIWKVASDYGSSDAQFYLAIMYSNYFSLPNLYSYYVNDEGKKEKSEFEEDSDDDEEEEEGDDDDDDDDDDDGGDDDEEDENIILARIYFSLKTKYLERETSYLLSGKKMVHEEKNRKTFRNIPLIAFNENNEIILKIKNIKYNTEELKEYFEKLENFPYQKAEKKTKENVSNKNMNKADENKKDENNKEPNYTRNHNLSLLYFYSSSLANHPGGVLSMGNKYMNGYGVEKNCDTAAKYYMKLTQDILNSDEKTEFEIIDLIRLNIPYYDKYNLINNKIKNIEILLETSLHGNHKLLTMIARRYLIGIDGVEKNYKKAFDYLMKASKYKNSEALSLLGYIYLLGLGVHVDYTKASEYFIEGNKLNDPLSANGLGYMHFFGLGYFKKNVNIAFHYFELAAKNNLSSAQFNLACLYLSGVGTTQSLRNAFYWLYKSLNNGNILAAYVIGFMHYNGVVTSRNCKMALSLLAKVAESNSFILNTTNQIIRYNEKGRNKEALFLMALLAETGHLQSQINLSYKIYSSDFSFFLPSDKNSNKIYASRYLAMASEHNDFKSLYTLGDYAYKGYGVYILILPKNNLPKDASYDVNDNSYLFKRKKTKESTITGKERKQEHKKENEKKKNSVSINDKNGLKKSNEIISVDFIDEEGNIFNENWRFHYSIKFAFNHIDYKLAYHHYKSIISFYPSNVSVIQTISRACYNLGYMHYYGIGVAKNIEKALIYFNSSIKIYPAYKAPSVFFVSYIKLNKYLYNLKKKIKKIFFFL